MVAGSVEAREPQRIAVLPPHLADQIAAGEVVERPASIVRELLENAIDAGARRIEVALVAGGLDKLEVVDDGRGIHPDDLPLAVTRHATSKVRSAADLHEISTLGFRGEALASTAAVAAVTLESRTGDRASGTRLRVRPGWEPQCGPVPMAPGTRVEVSKLFANVPARRKFMRSEATELAHCSDAVLRVALVHPDVYLRLTHGSRELFALQPGSQNVRVEAVLRRRGASSLKRIDGEHDNVGVSAWLCEPEGVARGTASVFVVVRRRVVRERNLAKIVAEAYADQLAAGRQPIACLFVDPPVGDVDVNVHPQKAEVRFGDPQRVYRAARAVLGTVRFSPEINFETPRIGQTYALDASASAQRYVAASGGATYQLRTRMGSGTGGAQDSVRSATHRRDAGPRDTAVAAPCAPEEPLVLLTCLPGPVAILRDGDTILAVDLKILRNERVRRLLWSDIGRGRIASQGLLQPVVVHRDRADVQCVAEAAPQLLELGVIVEPFGEDALLVRAVPAPLRSCVEEPDICDLVERLLPWVRLQRSDHETWRAKTLEALATTAGPDPSARLCRRWISELRAENVDLETVPGIRRYTARELLR